MKFKIGDVVRCIGNDRPDCAYKYGYGWEKGLIFTITSAMDVDNSNIACYFSGKDGCGVYEKYLELTKKTKKKLRECDLIL